uniref:Pseudo-response regulator 95 homologue n=1 Tax=Lemna gibba TaxID=4470 RepID=Q2PEF2_LEMGI|nr:pseudo-response regulator 95 homologue [Lemna gibba]
MAEEGEEMRIDAAGEEPRVVKWEKFLPRMFLRVLLVEADDSTRKIVAALLRKCGYKVSSASDGLEAWKTLKEKPNDTDLVLTEVELPNVSGYALLSMMMEHETCKSIPVIMMSSNDSMKMVFECMLKGAADFLVKPIRKNELRNLWQHVWRRQSSNRAENVPPVIGAANSEYNSASNHTSDCMDSNNKRRAGSEKGNDTQSSCTRPDREAEISDDLMTDREDISDKLERETQGKDDARETCVKVVESTGGLGQPSSSGEGDFVDSREDQTHHHYGFKRCRVLQPGQILGVDYNPAFKHQLKLDSVCNFRGRIQWRSAQKQGHKLNHSSSSAFSWYSAKSTLSPLPPPTENPDAASSENPNSSSPTSLFYTQPGQPETLKCPDQKTPRPTQDDHSSITYENGAPQSKLRLSIEREAALTKFRLKRKDRCFEKKVRYQSRKKLAEQRPRVKGQFVRQVNSGL